MSSIICEKRKYITETEEHRWLYQVFGINQILFNIFVFIEFPSVLYLSAVHSSFRAHLWPYCTLPNTLFNKILNNDPVIHFRTKNARQKHNRQQQSFIRHESTNFVPSERDCKIAVSSINASYAPYVKHAVIRHIPKLLSQATPMLNQLFTAYNQIETVTLFTKNIRDEYVPRNEFVRMARPINIWQQLMQSNNLALKFNLILTGPFIFDFSFLKHLSVVNLNSIIFPPLQLNRGGFIASGLIQWLFATPSVKHLTLHLQGLMPMYFLHEFFVSHAFPSNLKAIEIHFSPQQYLYHPTHMHLLHLHALTCDLKKNFPSLQQLKFISSVRIFKLSIVSFPNSLKHLHHSNCIILSPNTIQLLNACSINIVNIDTVTV
jgi:hypothetical protein